MIRKNARTRISSTLRILGCVALLTLFSACKAYQLGSPAEIPFQSLYIKPVANQSFAPQAQPILSAMLRENFIRDVRHCLIDRRREDKSPFQRIHISRPV